MAKAMKRSWRRNRGRFVKKRLETGHRPGPLFEKPTSPRTRKGLLGHAKSGWMELREMLVGCQRIYAQTQNLVELCQTDKTYQGEGSRNKQIHG